MRIQMILAGFACAAMATGAYAAGPISMQPAPAYNPAGFNFDGFYLGAQGGGDVGTFSAGSIGVVAGANYAISDPVVGGIEFQTDALLNGTGAYDFYTLGRLGVVVTNNFMAYGDAGIGWRGGNFGYTFGGGGEYALTDAMSAKGEVLGNGNWGSNPDSAKVQVGLLFHLQ